MSDGANLSGSSHSGNSFGFRREGKEVEGLECGVVQGKENKRKVVDAMSWLAKRLEEKKKERIVDVVEMPFGMVVDDEQD